ncbi:MAG: ATP-binding cassette domain-containing protein [Acholeplasmataceae bacterium]|nr:ATP-binding cassette domain-containing protein [Acholeplasmataceae bacterium]
MIEIKNLSKSYGDFQVLKDINLVIPEQKITALIGANGAGKSTLLGVISRLLPHQSGHVYLDDIDLKTLKDKDIAKSLSILKQSNQLMIRITVKELVTFGRYPHQKGKLTQFDKDKIQEALTYMKIEDIKDKYLDQLSGGQRQRAYIAMILAQDTKYILLDEPLNNLDMKHAVEMMMILDKLVKDYQKTIVIVMHDINIASSFSDYIVAMKDGEIIEQGEVDYMMNKHVLDHVFDHDFCIAGVHGKKVCVYYNQQQVNQNKNKIEQAIILQDYSS